MTTAPTPQPVPWDRVQRRALVAGGAGLGLFVLAAVLVLALAADQVPALLRSYLVAWTFWLGIALGGLAVVMMQHLTGGAWGVLVRKGLEAGSMTLPLLAVLFVPVAIGVHRLYTWADSTDPGLAEKQRYYLNVPFFLIRAVFYFAVWIGLAYLLHRWSGEEDRAVPRSSRRFRQLSGPGLALYGLTITFASVDWVMSLEPHWYSSIYGAIFGVGQVLSGLAFGVALLVLLSDVPPLAGLLRPDHLRDLGSLLLTFVMLWAYMSFSQYLIIWSGNLSEEIPWYLRRLQGGWQWFGLLLALFHFALPFLLLLSTDIKRNRRRLAAVAGLVLVMRFVDLFWLIVPAHDDFGDPALGGVGLHGLDIVLALVAVVGLGGVWVALFIRHLRGRPLLPRDAEALLEVAHHA